MNSVSEASFFDELTKLAEIPKSEPEKSRSLMPALKAMGVSAVGGALGYGAAELLSRNLGFLQHAPDQATLDKRVKMVKIILPILLGTSAMLGERYRNKMNDEYSKVKGYKAPKRS